MLCFKGLISSRSLEPSRSADGRGSRDFGKRSCIELMLRQREKMTVLRLPNTHKES